MPKLSASERARLPDSAFAYIDSRGRRRLPIHDEAHVRNALARFGRVSFESDAARDRARKRLLRAAKRYGIVPVGFMDGQLRSERSLGRVEARSTSTDKLPTGSVTFLFTDIEDSTGLLSRLGDGYARVLDDVRDIMRRAVLAAGGCEVDARADEYFGVFEEAAAAIRAAVVIQRALNERAWPEGATVRVRAGVHSGRPTLTPSGYIGIAVHTAARVCSAAAGGQVLVSSETAAARGLLEHDVRLRPAGRFRLAGLRGEHELFALEADGLPGT